LSAWEKNPQFFAASGAGGYFEVTADVTRYTKPKFLSQVGKRTEVFARFSTVGGENGSADATRDLYEDRAPGLNLRPPLSFYPWRDYQ
jgi:hypothetical protein